jgi:hypothetical protein
MHRGRTHGARILRSRQTNLRFLGEEQTLAARPIRAGKGSESHSERGRRF